MWELMPSADIQFAQEGHFEMSVWFEPELSHSTSLSVLHVLQKNLCG